jgi:hypothetical protein
LIPEFDSSGVLPSGRYPATAVEIEHRFVATFPASHTRRAIYDGWRQRREELFALVEVEYEWVDGSFVTSKSEPSDLDVVTFVAADRIAALRAADQARVGELTVGAYPRITFGCHSFLTVVTDESQTNEHNFYLWMRGYWDKWWTDDRTVTSKGYLEVRGPA